MQDINMNLLKYFYYVAKYNSYTKAAEILLISQPSLSYSIKVLELQLGKKLFNRGKTLELTTYGEYLYKQVEEIMNIMDNISFENEVKGKIVIGLRLQYAYKVFPYYFNQLSKIYPDLSIEYIPASSERLKELLYTSQIDILIDEYEYNGEYESFIQATDEVIFIKSSNNKIKYTDEIIKNSKIAISYHNKVTKEIKKLYPELNYLDFQSTPPMLLSMKKEELIAISPRSVVQEEIINNELEEVKSKIKLPDANLYITYNKKLKNKNTEAVVNFFREHSFYNLQKETSN